jgi:hypothetical protein
MLKEILKFIGQTEAGKLIIVLLLAFFTTIMESLKDNSTVREFVLAWIILLVIYALAYMIYRVVKCVKDRRQEKIVEEGKVAWREAMLNVVAKELVEQSTEGTTYNEAYDSIVSLSEYELDELANELFYSPPKIGKLADAHRDHSSKPCSKSKP